MTRTESTILLRAAEMLDDYAQQIFDSEVVRYKPDPNFGKVEDADVRREIDEHRSVARRLRTIAGQVVKVRDRSSTTTTRR